MTGPKYFYLNIYKHTGGYTISHYHATRAEADVAAKQRTERISCLRVEFRDGQLDPDESIFVNVLEYADTYTLSQGLHQSRKEADAAQTRSSKRVACVRVPLVSGRFDP